MRGLALLPFVAACAGADGPLSPEELAPFARCESASDCVMARNAPPSCCQEAPFANLAPINDARRGDLAAQFDAPDCSDVGCPAILGPTLDARFTRNRFELACVDNLCTVAAEHEATGQDCTGSACPEAYVCVDNGTGFPEKACFYDPLDPTVCELTLVEPPPPTMDQQPPLVRYAPYPVDRSSCATDEVIFPGGGCVLIGTSTCALPDQPGARYVDASVVGPGTGTRLDPFPTVAAAGVQPGEIIVAAGDYPQVTIPEGVRIRGACASGTRFASVSMSGGGLENARAASVLITGTATLTDVRVEGPVEVNTQGRLVATALAIDGSGAVGLDVEGTLFGERILIRDRDVAVRLPGTATLRNVTVEGGGIGLEVTGALDLSAAGIFDTAAEGVLLRSGEARLAEVLIESAHGAGVAIAGGVASGDVAVFDARPAQADQSGVGVAILTGGQWSGGTLLLEANRGIGLLARGVVTLDGLWAIDTALDDSGVQGYGAWIDGGELRLDHGLVERSIGIGIFVQNGGMLAAEDLRVADTQAGPDGLGGVGLLAASASTIELSRSTVANSRTAGLIVQGSEANLLDLLVEDVQADATGALGVGLWFSAANVNLSKTAIVQSTMVGMLITEAADVAAEDLVIDQVSGEDEEQTGRGLWVDAADLALRSARISGARDTGLFVAGSSAEVSVDDTRIVGTSRRTCAPGCAEGIDGGFGLGAYLDADVVIRRSIVEGSEALGLHANVPALSLVDTVIRMSPIGVSGTADLDSTGVCFDSVPVPVDTGAFEAPNPQVPDLPRF